jgi:hypothetical protein
MTTPKILATFFGVIVSPFLRQERMRVLTPFKSFRKWHVTTLSILASARTCAERVVSSLTQPGSTLIRSMAGAVTVTRLSLSGKAAPLWIVYICRLSQLTSRTIL